MSGSLPDSERSLAEQHIAICEGCRLELELVRAIGSQEKQPAGSKWKDDWTLDRIFGAASSSAKDSAPATPAATREGESAEPSGQAPIFGSSEAAPAPPPPHPALVPDSDDPGSEPPAERKKVEASWSFEPVDATSDVKPPEESLFFAAEALTRNRAGGRKSSNARVVLWSLGGVVGVGLLAFSAWFVLHMKSTPASRIHAAPAPTAPTTDVRPSPERTPNDGEIQDKGGQPPNSSVEATPPPPAEPRVSASTAPQPMPLAARTPASPSPTKPTASTPLATHGTGQHATEPDLKAPGSTHPATKVTTRRAFTAADSAWSPDEVTAEDDGDAESTPAVESPSTAPTRTPSTHRGSAIWESRAPKSDSTAGTEPKAPSQGPTQAEISSPIGRLHLATVAATERGDLDGLRRLRNTWKSFMVKIIGPDRARAKREYADCLWAIQDETGRRSDQKDALAAYREYLLGAPAGGADSRSVSRLRQLEDALAERR